MKEFVVLGRFGGLAIFDVREIVARIWTLKFVC